jgi:hypothetical protein
LPMNILLECMMTPPLGMSSLMTFIDQLLMPPPTTLPTSSDNSVNPCYSMSPSSLSTPLPSPSSPDLPCHQHNPLPTPSGNYPSTHLPDSPQMEPLLLKLSEHTHMKFPSTLAAVVGDEDGESLASGAPRASLSEVRREEPTSHRSRSRSRSESVPDNTHCPICDGPREYCHGHSPSTNSCTPHPSAANTLTCPSSSRSDPPCGNI